MLAKIQRTFSQFFAGENSENVTRNRKRSLESDVGEDVLATSQAKRLKKDPSQNSANQSWAQQFPIAKVAEWLVRKKTSWSEKYHIREVFEQASPKTILGRIRKLGTSPTNGIKQPSKDDSSNQSPPQQNQPVMFRVPPFNRMDTDPAQSLQPQVSSTPLQLTHSSPSDIGGFSFIRQTWPSSKDYSMQPGVPPNDRMPHRSGHSPMGRLGLGTSHHYGYQSVYDKAFAGKTNSTQNRSRDRKSWQRNRGKLMAQESVRLDEKSRYANLLQTFQHGYAPTTIAGSLAPMRGNSSLFHPAHRYTSNSSFRDSSSNSSTKSVRQAPPPTVDLTRDGEVSIIKVCKDKSTAKPDITERSFVDLTSRRSSQDDEVIDLSSEESRSSTASQERVSTKAVKQPGGSLFQDVSVTPRLSRQAIRRLPTSSTKSALEKSLHTSFQTPAKPESARAFEKAVRDSPYINEDWIKDLTGKYSSQRREREHWVKEEEIRVKVLKEKREEWDKQLEDNLRRRLSLAEREPPVLEEDFSDTGGEEDEFPELTPDADDIISSALARGAPSQVLSDGFRLQITRNDMATLAGLNWLNDEVINFYMSLLMDRSQKDESLPRVYAFNSFFYPKLMSGGHAALKRWTKRVDLFAHDYILVPVHLGMHWCLAVVDLKKKQVRYYDSMGGKNKPCLQALRMYLETEHREKKSSMLDTSQWEFINVKDIPQQMNGSDCGMFACKYAEYITRDVPITFGQEHMPYFRRKMVYEIMTKNLL